MEFFYQERQGIWNRDVKIKSACKEAKYSISSRTQQRCLMQVSHFFKKRLCFKHMGYCNGFGGIFWGVRRENLVSLTQKIKQSNHNVQSEKRRISKESVRTHSKNNKTVWRAGKREWPIHKADFISTLPRLDFLACLSPSCSRQSSVKLASPSFQTCGSYLGFLSFSCMLPLFRDLPSCQFSLPDQIS